ncbi:MAG: tetratricopeptide repeat protein [Planctomycetota bacterium]|nr:tetratricopeptide repeat protein [Planctomycetota bacterium]
MPLPKPNLFVIAATLLIGCSSGPTDEEIAVRVDDLRQRSATYFNQGSYYQAFQQAKLGIELTGEDDGELNLLAGHARMMMRDLKDVAASQPYLEKASDLLDDYRADLVLGEFHQRYGSMLNAHAVRMRQSISEYPSTNEEQKSAETEINNKRFAKAQEHFSSAIELFLIVLDQSPDDLYALQLIGQSYTLRKNYTAARTHLNHALDLFKESRQYKNRVLATDVNITLSQESRLRSELIRDIEGEVAIRMLLAGIDNIEGNNSQELSQYSEILGLQPQNLDALYGRGLSHYQLGNFRLAHEDLKLFLGTTSLPFDNSRVQRALEITSDTSN